ncbi:MAG: hypothetical protein ABSD38_34400 [Syntrophorhabdales bacterium]|jgi:hypothetical protein
MTDRGHGVKTEEVMKLSTDILCALIDSGLLPAAGGSVDSTATTVRDYLHAIGQEVRNVYSLLDEEKS